MIDSGAAIRDGKEPEDRRYIATAAVTARRIGDEYVLSGPDGEEVRFSADFFEATFAETAKGIPLKGSGTWFNPHSSKKRAIAIRLLRKGQSVAQVQRTIGIGEQTIRRWRRVAGIRGRPRRPKSPTLQDEQRIASEYATGFSLRETGERLGFTAGQVRHVLLRLRVKRRGSNDHRRPPAEEVASYLRLLRAGLSMAEIARRFQRSGGTVAKALREAGVPPLVKVRMTAKQKAEWAGTWP